MKGRWMAAEIAEQPAVLARLGARCDEIQAQTASAVDGTPAGIVLVARGSSANAALFGRHALGLATRAPAMLASLSLGAADGVDVTHTGWVSIGVSQSGRTPEIVEALRRHGRAGARTIAVTNAADSPLAEVATTSIDVGAGPERAVPATKTFTAQLAAFAIMAGALSGEPVDPEAWNCLVRSVSSCLDDDEPVAEVRRDLAAARSLVVCGRGFGYPVAREAALKIKEVTGITAEAYSHLDLLHGPIAVTGADVPTIVVDLRGATERDADRLVAELQARSAPFYTIGDRAGADIPVPDGLPEPLAAIVATVRMQQLAFGLAIGRDLDPDVPHGLSKITLT